jgi:hypothetical protein
MSTSIGSPGDNTLPASSASGSSAAGSSSVSPASGSTSTADASLGDLVKADSLPDPGTGDKDPKAQGAKENR